MRGSLESRANSSSGSVSPFLAVTAVTAFSPLLVNCAPNLELRSDSKLVSSERMCERFVRIDRDSRLSSTDVSEGRHNRRHWKPSTANESQRHRYLSIKLAFGLTIIFLLASEAEKKICCVRP